MGVSDKKKVFLEHSVVDLIEEKRNEKKEACSVKGRSGHFGQGGVWNADKGVLILRVGTKFGGVMQALRASRIERIAIVLQIGNLIDCDEISVQINKCWGSTSR
jgi:hypothetical protein